VKAKKAKDERSTFRVWELLQAHSDHQSALEAILTWLEERKRAGKELPFEAVDLASVLIQSRSFQHFGVPDPLWAEREKFRRVAMLLDRVRFIGSAYPGRLPDRLREILRSAPNTKPAPANELVEIDLVSKFKDLLKLYLEEKGDAG
jgi:hypothetical protein